MMQLPSLPEFYRCAILALVELSKLVVAAEHVDNLVLVHLLHHVACRTAVLTWVELSRLLCEYLAHSGCEGKTRVRVDVDLADGAL